MRSAFLLTTVVLGVAGVLVARAPAAGPATAPSSPTSLFESTEVKTAAGPLDKIVLTKLSALGIRPVLCSDAVFVRRAYLDLTGTIPTAQEARNFIEDTEGPAKRRALVERLLSREEYADYMAMKWGDVLRIKAEFPVNLWPNAAQAYHHWVREAVANNKPYDKFVREMLTSSGSNVREGPVNFYRAIQNRTPDGIASAVALAFMGARTDAWPKDRLAGMSVFFSQIGYKNTREWKEEVVFWDPFRIAPPVTAEAAATPPEKKKEPAAPVPPPELKPLETVFPDGTKVTIPVDRDPREVFANWLITEKNPWFARAMVNRTWYWLMGRGIIHEPDDIRDNNPPSNPDLLAYLEHEFVASHYDVKQLIRLIVNSQAYQFSAVPRFQGSAAEANFATYPLRRLDAEVLIDAINQVTGASDLYTSAIPEPFTYIPKDKPAVTIADGSITSPFLALFGRSARATGMESERINKVVSAQWLHLLNSSHIQRKIDQGPKIKAIIDSGRKSDEVTTDLYLTILSRFPTADELKNAREYGQMVPVGKGPKRNMVKRHDDWVDITWALFNSAEFLYRH